MRLVGTVVVTEPEQIPGEAPVQPQAYFDGKPCTVLATYEMPLDLMKLQDDLRIYAPVVARAAKRKGPRVHRDHKGNEYPTLSKMCEAYNIKESVYRGRINKGWTVEEALTGIRADCPESNVVDHLGNHYRSVSEMCKHYGVRPDSFCQRRKRGWTLEETLNGKRNTTVTDHLGNTFPDLNAMCAFHGVKRSTYHQRLRNGATLEQALSKARHVRGDRQGNPTVDHEGKEYPSQRAMCRAYGIKVAAFRARLRNGYSLEDALTAAHGAHRERTAEKVTDYKGEHYTSVKKMCEAYGVNQGTYYSRLNKGMTMEQALSVNPVRHQGRPTVEVTDHKGQTFPSVKAMCDAYGVNYCTYRQRLGNGASLEEALTTPRGRKGSTMDHLGNTYETVKDMCDAYGVSLSTYRARVRQGLSLEEALTKAPAEDEILNDSLTPVLSGPCKDHLGNEYSDPGEMAKAYGLTKDQYLSRARFGWDVKSILTTPLRSSGRRKGLSYNGKEYTSRKALCADLGLNYNSFIIRLTSGMSLEEAVTACLNQEPANNRKVAVKDHKGVQYDSISKMCQAYGISPTVYTYRLAHGMSLEQVLTEPLKPRRRPKATAVDGADAADALEDEEELAPEAEEESAPEAEVEPAPEETPAEEA